MRPIVAILAVLWLILQFFTNAGAQDLEVRITIPQGNEPIIEVEGRTLTNRFASNADQLHFLDTYGSAGDLSKRVENMTASTNDGREAKLRNIAPGLFLSDDKIAAWKYSVNASPRSSAFAAAHISWIKGGEGHLMLDDLLPQFGKNVSARVVIVATERSVITAEKATTVNTYHVEDIERSVFFITSSIRDRGLDTPAGQVVLSVEGEWHFRIDEAAEVVRELLKSYVEQFGKPKGDRFVIAIRKFPTVRPQGSWEADTRGQTVTLVSADMPFKSQSLPRLHEQLRHEIFHLWVPGSLSFSGNYDWYYEGFALYHSLKAGLSANRIRFETLLSNISFAIEKDRIANDRRSLIELSKRRWQGSDVYSRGVLAAFMIDIAMIETSKGKRNIDDLTSQIIIESRNGKHLDGSTEILRIIKQHKELSEIADALILGDGNLDLKQRLLVAGIEISGDPGQTKLTVVAKPNRRQKEILDELGYNNWRKLSGK